MRCWRAIWRWVGSDAPTAGRHARCDLGADGRSAHAPARGRRGTDAAGAREPYCSYTVCTVLPGSGFKHSRHSARHGQHDHPVGRQDRSCLRERHQRATPRGRPFLFEPADQDPRYDAGCTSFGVRGPTGPVSLAAVSTERSLVGALRERPTVQPTARSAGRVPRGVVQSWRALLPAPSEDPGLPPAPRPTHRAG